MQKMAATGVNVAACRHTGKAADIVIVKGDSTLLEPREVWRMDRLSAVGLHCSPVERVQKDKNDLHCGVILRDIYIQTGEASYSVTCEQSFAYQSHHSIIKPRHKQKMTYG